MKKFYLLSILCLSFCILRAQVNLSLGLAAYYPFTGNANDASGNNNNPSFNNAVLTTDHLGNPNSAYHFNGVNTYIQIPNSPSINFGTSMSICAWVRVTGFYTGTCYNDMMVGKLTNDYIPGNYSLRFSDYLNGCSGSPSTTDETFSAEPDPALNTVIIQPNQWYSVVSTSDGTTTKMYINCQLVSSIPQTATDFTNSLDLFLGYLNNSTFPYWLNGDLDEVRLYNRAINQDEVNAYGGCISTCTPTSSTLDTTICQGQSFNGHTATGTYVDTLLNVQGCDSIRTTHLITNSCAAPTCQGTLLMQGFDKVTLPLPDTGYYSPNGFTWECWFKGSAYENTNTTIATKQVLMLSSDSVPCEDIALSFGWPVGIPKNAIGFVSDGPGSCPGRDNNPCYYIPPGGFVPNTWYHVAAVRNYSTNQTQLYFNGVLVDTKSNSLAPITRNLSTFIGADTYYASDSGLVGKIDEIRIWNYPRTAAEITANYDHCLTGVQPGLVSYYHANESSGLVLHDITPNHNDGVLDSGVLFDKTDNAPLVNSCGSPSTTTFDTTICRGQSYAGYDSAGTYIDTYTNLTGCDSIRTLHLTVNNCTAPTCPLVNKITINTGYDPITQAQLPVGQKDTHWIVTSMSSQMQNALCYNANTTTAQGPPNVPTVPPVPLDQYSDIVPGWVGAISCFPVNTIYTSMPPTTPSSGNFSYTMDIKRSFFISGTSAQNVTFNFTTTCDDAIDSIIVDAGLPSQIVLLNVMTKTVGAGSPINTIYTASLSPGLHTLSIQCANWEDPIGGIYFPITVNGITSQYQWNPFVVTVTGSISTVNNVLVNDSCFKPTYSTIDTSICQGLSYLGHNITGTYIDTLTNVAGYDSIRTVNLIVNNCTPPIPCNVTKSLIINTGYNPITNTVIPAGQEDSNWKVTYVSPALLAVTGEGAIGSGTWTVINNPVWATNPTSNYISSVNNGTNGYNTILSPNGTYTSTETRTFTTLVPDNITFNLNITGDNYISGLSIDGGPNLITGPPNYSLLFINHTFTEFLNPGSHTIAVSLVNATIDKAYTNNDNYFGLNVYGTVSSSIGVNSLMAPGSAANCIYTSFPSYSTIDTSICQGQSFLGYNTTGTYIDTLANVAGYDSIRTVNLTVVNCTPPLCTLTNNLVINSGYNPVTKTQIASGQNDPNWIVTALSTDMQNSLCYVTPNNNSITFVAPPVNGTTIPASINQPASVITRYQGWQVEPGSYLSCFAGNTIYTPAPGTPTQNVTNCTMTIRRNFTVYGAVNEQVTFNNLVISCDNYLFSIIVDAGTPNAKILFNTGAYTMPSITIPNATISLSPGTHTIDILCSNAENPDIIGSGGVFYTVTANGTTSRREWNPFGISITGTLTSTNNILVSDSCCIPTASTLDTSICQGQSFRGHTTTGTYLDTIPNVAGCDSIMTLNLIIKPKSFSTIPATICQGQNYLGYTTAGTHTDTFVAANGCDSIRTIDLTVIPYSRSIIPATICQGQNYLGYTTSGTFVDTLIAANGCDSIRTIDLTVTPYSRSTIPMSICQGQNYFGHTTTGTFVDTLIATHGCDSIRTIDLTVNSPSSSIVDTSICPGEVSHGYSTGGTYTITLTNAVGCDSSITLNLTVKPLPIVKTNNDTSICKGTTFQVSTTGATTYSWLPLTSLTFPDNTSDPVTNTITPIQYIVTGTANGCSAKDTLNIGINPLPVVTKSNDVTICKDSSTRIYAIGGLNYQWSPNSSLNFYQNVNDPIASPLVSTTYHVVVTDANNCVNSDSIKVSVRPPAVFTISPDANACANVSTQLFSNGGDTYLWSPASLVSNAGIKSPTTAITTTTTYNVQIKENTCGTSATLYTTLTLLPGLSVSASKSNDLDCYIASATLSASGADKYLWSPSASLNDANIADPIARPFSTQKYIVKGTDELGCVGYDSVTVYGNFADRLVYNMANAFTPNNDGKNDCYGIEYLGPISQFTFIIYSRWGQEMFHTSDPTACWNGTFQGQDVGEGAYVYYIKAVTACGTTEKKGTVILIR